MLRFRRIFIHLPVRGAHHHNAHQIPDISDDIQDQLLGHDTYRRRLAMARNVRKSQQESGAEQVRANLVASLGVPNEESSALQSLPEVPRKLALRGCVCASG